MSRRVALLRELAPDDRSGRRVGAIWGQFLGRVLLLGVLAALLPALPAYGHNRLLGTDPGDGGELARTPASVELRFSEPALALGTRLTVTGPDGEVQVGPPRLVDDTVAQDLQPGAPAGRYTVAWRVTSADGHPISGTFSFTSAAAGTASPPPSASPPDVPVPAPAGPSVPAWAWALVVVALVAAPLVVLGRVRRGRR